VQQQLMRQSQVLALCEVLAQMHTSSCALS
jgi:hypothetical protein